MDPLRVDLGPLLGEHLGEALHRRRVLGRVLGGSAGHVLQRPLHGEDEALAGQQVAALPLQVLLPLAADPPVVWQRGVVPPALHTQLLQHVADVLLGLAALHHVLHRPGPALEPGAGWGQDVAPAQWINMSAMCNGVYIILYRNTCLWIPS